MNSGVGTYTRRAAIAASLAGAFALSACGSGSDSGGTNADGDKIIRMTVVPGASALPIRVAIDEGIFKKNGLQVEVTEGLEIAAWQSAVGKQFDIVFTQPAVYSPSIAKGLDNTIISNTTNASDDYVSVTMATKEKITDLSELKGKRIGAATLTGGTTEAFKYLMEKEGVKQTEYEIVQVPYSSQLDNLKAGNIDAGLTANPYYGTLERGDMHLWGKDMVVEAHKVASDGEVTTNSSTMFAANTTWLNENESTVNAWLDSVEEAMKLVNEDEAEARRVWKEWMDLPDQLAKDAIIPEYTTEVEEGQLSATWEVLVANGTVKGDYPADKVKIYER